MAVLLVLVWHARIPGISRGYVGVDAFFVISGFLITGLLVSERRSTGTLDLAEFYSRRVRRLLPASALVIGVTVVLTLLWMPEIRWSSISGEVLASALYFQNWRLAGQSINYVAQDAAAGPLQHYWSLAVEEQFYLVWPLLLTFATPRGSVRRGSFDKRLGVCVLAIFVASFGWSVYYTNAWPGPAYFVSTTRAWEFAIGAGLAIYVGWPGRRAIASRVSDVVSWVGLALLIGSAFYLPAQYPFPGFVALVPTLGTAAVIAGGLNGTHRGALALLGLRPLVFVGTISYSLYLWHWPLLVVLGARFGPLEVWQSAAIVLGSAIPAYLAFRFVETPVRRWPRLVFPRHGLVLAVACTVLATGCAIALSIASPRAATVSAQRQAELDAITKSLDSVAAVTKETLVESSEQPSEEASANSSATQASGPSSTESAGLGALSLDEPGEQNGFVQASSVDDIVPDPIGAVDDIPQQMSACRQEIQPSEVLNCVLGQKDSDKEIALVGDSHAAQWISALDAIARNKGFRLTVYSKAACHYTGLMLAVTKARQEYKSCSIWNTEVRRRLLADRPQIVLVTGVDQPVIRNGVAMSIEDSRQLLVADEVSRWNELIANGSKLVALADTPIPDFDVPECVSTNRGSLDKCTFAQAGSDSKGGLSMKSAVEQVPGAIYIDVNDAICPGTICPVVVGGVLVYRDPTHLTDTYVRTLTPTLAEALSDAGAFSEP